jgi:hypothetical protein
MAASNDAAKLHRREIISSRERERKKKKVEKY